MEFGTHLKAERLRLGLSQEEIAARAGTTAESISDWECGRHRPQLHQLVKLAEVVGRDRVWFVGLARPLEARRMLLDEEDTTDGLREVERDPFGWRLQQAMRARALQPRHVARAVGVSERTVSRWLAGPTVPSWDLLWQLAELVDLPVWWWRCGGEDEQAMFGPYELRGRWDEPPADVDAAWKYAEDVSQRYGVAVSDIIRVAWPSLAGWRWEGRLDRFAARKAPQSPFAARLEQAVAEYCAQDGRSREDAIAWISDFAVVGRPTVRRWLADRRTPQWPEAARTALALGHPAWALWAPVENEPKSRVGDLPAR